jgi:hypothetical protein
LEDKLLQPKSRRGNGSKPGISGSEIGGDAQRHRAGRCEVPLEAGKQRLERRLKFGGALSRLAAQDPQVHRLLVEVRHLLKPSSALRDLVERVDGIDG